MWAFAVLLVMAAGMFPLQAHRRPGSQREAGKIFILVGLALVTFLTVIFTRGLKWQAPVVCLAWFDRALGVSFQKIGVAFMPALDEGTTLDMPITVPRGQRYAVGRRSQGPRCAAARLSRSRIRDRQSRSGRYADRSRAARHGRNLRQFPAQGAVAQASPQVCRRRAANRRCADGARRTGIYSSEPQTRRIATA